MEGAGLHFGLGHEQVGCIRSNVYLKTNEILGPGHGQLWKPMRGSTFGCDRVPRTVLDRAGTERPGSGGK